MYHIFISLLFLSIYTIEPISCEIKQFSYNDFKKAIQDKIENPLAIVDVREQSEINETGMIPESIHVPCKYKS